MPYKLLNVMDFKKSKNYCTFILILIAIIVVGTLIIILTIDINSDSSSNKFYGSVDIDDSYSKFEYDSTLILANVLFRHGDRAPLQSYPNDPYANYSWYNGFGALSQKGISQAFNLGKILRRRYRSLLPCDGLYLKSNMKVISSISERCILTASSFLAGFMPPPPPSPINHQTNNRTLPIAWQPIPIYPIPKSEDKILVVHSAPCEKYDKLYNEMLTNETSTFNLFQKDYIELYHYLTEYVGLNITNMFHVDGLYDIFTIQLAAGLQLPEWAKRVYPHKMRYLHEQSVAFRTETKFMKMIKGGPILTEFLDNVGKYNATRDVNTLLYIYSGHDSTLAYLMRALEIIDQTTLKPEYAAAITMEIHSNIELLDDYEIRLIYYRDSDDEHPLNVQIPNCKAPCSIKEFTKSVESILVRDYEGSCKL